MTTTPTSPTPVAYLAVLPGPDRRRNASLYQYRTVYRNLRPEQAGCVAAWEVLGGRMAYQVALERDERGGLRWHCTCADAVYRGERTADHVCKHVRGLQAFLPPPATSKAA